MFFGTLVVSVMVSFPFPPETILQFIASTAHPPTLVLSERPRDMHQLDYWHHYRGAQEANSHDSNSLNPFKFFDTYIASSANSPECTVGAVQEAARADGPSGLRSAVAARAGTWGLRRGEACSKIHSDCSLKPSHLKSIDILKDAHRLNKMPLTRCSHSDCLTVQLAVYTC